MGPNQLTIRDIADHAGVNHAQIHHYFGGKKGLLIATYKQLAFEHVQQLERRNVSPNDLGDVRLQDHWAIHFSFLIVEHVQMPVACMLQLINLFFHQNNDEFEHDLHQHDQQCL